MKNAKTFSDLIQIIKELNERLAQSRTIEEKREILREFRDVLREGDELIEKSS